MCVGVYTLVFNDHHPMWKRKENKTNTSSTTTQMVDRRGDLSPPVLLCNEYIWKNRNMRRKMEVNTQMGKVTQSLFITPELF